MTTINTSKKSTISADLFISKMELTLTFLNGKEIVIDANKLSQEIRDHALLHGLKQKLVDAAAISRDTTTGKAADVETKYQAVKKIADRLMAADGKWNEGRVSGETSAPVGNLFLRAIMKMTGHSEKFARDWLDSKTKEQRAALKKNPRVIAIIAELSAATVSNGINTDDLLGELGVVGDETGVDADGASNEGVDSPITPAAALAPVKPSARSKKNKLVAHSDL